MPNKFLLKSITVLSLTMTLLNTGGEITVHAFGPSPAFERKVKKSDKDISKLVLQDVRKKIARISPAMTAGYKTTALSKTLHTDYAKIDYPSITDGTKEGVDGDGNIVLSALKKPITESSKLELAELIRYYQFNMSPGLNFVPLNPKNELVGQQELDVSRKLNYFDYVTLIDTIANNSQYSQKEKSARLSQVEKDLANSISVLYGDTNEGQSLEAWGESKSVSIPFKRDKYSYKQLLAAYEKNDTIIDTLSYYSAILDVLDQIRQYSVDKRLGRDAKIDIKQLSENLNKKYNAVQKSLISPVADILSAKLSDENKLKAGLAEEQSQLQKAGVGGEKR